MYLQINRKSEHVLLPPFHETRYKTNFKCRIESNEQNTNIMSVECVMTLGEE